MSSYGVSWYGFHRGSLLGLQLGQCWYLIACIRRYWSPTFLNLFGLGVPTFMVLLVTSTAGIASRHYRNGMRLLLDVLESLAISSNNWNGTLSSATLINDLHSGEDFMVEWELLIKYVRITFALYAGLGMVKDGTFISASMFHLRALRATLEQVAACRGTRDGLGRETAMLNRYRTLVRLTVGFTVGSLFCEVVLIGAAVEARQVVTTSTSYEVVILVALYSYGILGLPISGLLVQGSLAEAQGTTSLLDALETNTTSYVLGLPLEASQNQEDQPTAFPAYPTHSPFSDSLCSPLAETRI